MFALHTGDVVLVISVKWDLGILLAFNDSSARSSISRVNCTIASRTASSSLIGSVPEKVDKHFGDL